MREAVSGYRQPTLVDELAGARMALSAAGIDAELHGADAELPADVEALLAWTVREGTTNVIRHSGARTCRIAVQPNGATASAEVVDDGRRARRGGRRAGQRPRRPARARRAAARPRRGGAGAARAASGCSSRCRCSGRDVIRILIAEDQVMVREAIASLLELEDELERRRAGRPRRRGAGRRPRAQPDVALLDIEMPGRDRPR